MATKHVTYTIPEKLDLALHAKVGRGKMSRFVTQALWRALKEEEDLLLMEFLEADKDHGNSETAHAFSSIEGEDFIGIEGFEGNL